MTTHGRPDPDAVPYHIVHETVASVNDGDGRIIVITVNNGLQRPYPSGPEGLNTDWYEEDTGYSVEYVLNLDAGYWDIESRDMCRLVAIEQRKREDKRRKEMSRDSGFWAVLKYMKDAEGSGFQSVELPHYELGDEYGTGKLSRIRIDDLVGLTTRGKRHDLKKHANHDDKTLDDFCFMRQRKFGDPSGLPP